jgi:hypothetical protein
MSGSPTICRARQFDVRCRASFSTSEDCEPRRWSDERWRILERIGRNLLTARANIVTCPDRRGGHVIDTIWKLRAWAFRANREGERRRIATNLRPGNLTPVPVRHANIGIDQRVTSHTFSPLDFMQNGCTS